MVQEQKYHKTLSRILLGAIFLGLVAAMLFISNFKLAGFLNCVTIFVVVFFFVYLIRHISFAWAALGVSWNPTIRKINVESASVVEQPLTTENLPTLSILLPCHNEAKVIRRLVERLMVIDYPADKYEVIAINDGSKDKTAELLDGLKSVYAPKLKVLHRLGDEWKKKPGKSAALNKALEIATGEVIAVYDADHLPEMGSLKLLVRHFKNPSVGAAMGRCMIINRDYNLLTKLIYIDYLSGYLANEYGRQTIHNLPAYGGANCAVRRSLLEFLGGYNVDTVTEDTDINTRTVLAGYDVVFERDAVSWEESVDNLRIFWKQRYRWAYGHQHVLYDYFIDVLTTKNLDFLQKVEYTMFLFLFHGPVIMFIGLILVVLYALGLGVPFDPIKATSVWILMFLGPFTEMGAGMISEKRLGGYIPHPLYLIMFFPLFFVSIFLCTKAFFDGIIRPIIGRRYVWVKTERSGVVSNGK